MVRNGGDFFIPGECEGSRVSIQTSAHKVDGSKGMTIT